MYAIACLDLPVLPLVFRENLVFEMDLPLSFGHAAGLESKYKSSKK